MGVELELHAARPPRDRGRPTATVLRKAYEYGDALSAVLLQLEKSGAGLLRYVDPYGDTTFNEQQAAAALEEIPGLLERCSDDCEVAAVQDLRGLLRACARTRGSHLWFIGD